MWLRRGVNLGNALDAPNEGEWGYRIELSDLDAIAAAGFDGVRLPVRWDAHAMPRPPYTIETHLLVRVAEVVEAAMARGLSVQLDMHHYADLIANPAAERARFLALWRQIAERFAAAGPGLTFELLNEPHGPAWRGRPLAALQQEAIALIRPSNRQRLIVLGPGNYNGINALDDWPAPEADNIAVSVHYYEPHDFTHHRAEWLGEEAPLFPRAWGSAADRAAVEAHIARAAQWAARRGLSLQLGEFGVNRKVARAQRALWTETVRRACEARGIGWCVWDFAGAFPVFDRETRQWLPDMRTALLD